MKKYEVPQAILFQAPPEDILTLSKAASGAGDIYGYSDLV